METTQSPTPILPVTSSSPGFFSRSIPSSVAFAVAILLFILPFAEIKCGNSTIANKSGLDFAMGKEWKAADNSGMFGQNDLNKNSMSSGEEEKRNSQIFAVAALGLGVLGLLLSFANAKTGGAGGLFTGVLSAGALIGLMFEVKKNFNKSIADQAADKSGQGSDDFGLNRIGDTMNDMKPVLDFTPWFFVAVVAFLAAAFFCYKRMRSARIT